jgi:hypothetical protein
MFKALNTLLNSADYTYTYHNREKSVFVSMPKFCFDTATGGLYVTNTCQVVVYAPALRADKLFLFLESLVISVLLESKPQMQQVE